MRIMRSRQPALPAPPHPLMRVAAATSASPRRPGCTRLYFPHSEWLQPLSRWDFFSLGGNVPAWKSACCGAAGRWSGGYPATKAAQM